MHGKLCVTALLVELYDEYVRSTFEQTSQCWICISDYFVSKPRDPRVHHAPIHLDPLSTQPGRLARVLQHLIQLAGWEVPRERSPRPAWPLRRRAASAATGPRSGMGKGARVGWTGVGEKMSPGESVGRSAGPAQILIRPRLCLGRRAGPAQILIRPMMMG